MKQSDIVKLLRKEFGLHEVTVFSASAKNRAGVLDCEIAYRGQSFWVEIKIGNDKLSLLQKSFMKRHYKRAMALTFGDAKIEICLCDENGILYSKYIDYSFSNFLDVYFERM